MSEEVEPYLLDRKRAAAFLGVSAKTVGEWYKQGKMPEPELTLPRKNYWSRPSLVNLRESLKEKVAQNRTK